MKREKFSFLVKFEFDSFETAKEAYGLITGEKSCKKGNTTLLKKNHKEY